MSASKMISLSLYFGILIGDLVPETEKSWTFYIVIRELIELLLSRSFTVATIDYLKILIEEHHTLFFKLFNEPLKPKFHIILHYPDIILKIGPLRNIWCMKFEAYHKLLKSTIKTSNCYKNLLKTLSTKNSLCFSQRLFAKRGFVKEIEYNQIDYNFEYSSGWNFSKDAFCVSWIKVYGSYFKRNFVIQLSDENILLPKFGQIQQIIVDDQNKIFFIVKYLFTIGLISHIGAYEVVEKNQTLHLYSFNSIANQYPLNIHYTGDGKSVIPKL